MEPFWSLSDHGAFRSFSELFSTPGCERETIVLHRPWTHARTAAASSQPRAALRTTLGDFAAESQPQDRRIRTAIVRHRRDTGPDPDLAATSRQVSAARPMRAGVLSSDRALSPGWACDSDARRKVPSRTDGERSVASRSPSDIAARRRACVDARASVRSPAPLQACTLPFVADELSTDGPPSHVSLRRWASRLAVATDDDEPICSENKADA